MQSLARGSVMSLNVFNEDPLGMLAKLAIDKLDLLELATPVLLGDDLRRAVTDLAAADLVEVVGGAHAHAVARHLDGRHRLRLADATLAQRRGVS